MARGVRSAGTTRMVVRILMLSSDGEGGADRKRPARFTRGEGCWLIWNKSFVAIVDPSNAQMCVTRWTSKVPVRLRISMKAK